MTAEFPLAVHALVYLNHRKIFLSSEALSENICTNPARVRKVMSALKRAGLVETREGSSGGYAFCGKADEVTLRQISQALDTCFVSSSWKSGSIDMNCLVASGMADIMDGIYADLNEACRSVLEKITIADIDQKIFGK